MLVSTEGIVLRSIKYRESSVIATIYTRDFGRQTYLINAARSKKSKNRASLLQPLFLVDLVAYQKQMRDMHRIKEIKINDSYQNIPFDIAKSTQAIFLSELLYKTVNEQERFPELFDFMKSALQYFDLMDDGWVNFHLFFLFRLTEYLGFMPNTTKSSFEGWWDLQKGKVVSFEPPHPFYANKELTEKICDLSVLKIHEISRLKLTRKQRESLLSKLIEYYQLHFENLGEIKSLRVLKEVFD